MGKNRLQYSWKFWTGILLVQFSLFYILTYFKTSVYFFELFFELQKDMHQKIFSWIPFSFGDILYVAVCIYILYLFVNLFSKTKRKKSLLKLLYFGNISLFLYQIFWGQLYFQKPISKSLAHVSYTENDLKNLALVYLEECKTKRELVTEDLTGRFHIENLNEIQIQIQKASNKLPKKIARKTTNSTISIKKSLFSKAMNYSGINGYYNPFTAEAQFNANIPHSQLLSVITHEYAHQLGYAREEEASFIAYLIGENSHSKTLQYSVKWHALKSLLRNLHLNSPEFVEDVLKDFSPKMKTDYNFERFFYEEHSGLAESFFDITNNIFLKSNRQEGNITYSYFVDLLVRYKIESLKN